MERERLGLAVFETTHRLSVLPCQPAELIAFGVTVCRLAAFRF